MEHDLYKTGDADAPEGVKDRNGDVALGCCRRCGAGEIELEEDCEERQHRLGKPLEPERTIQFGYDCLTLNGLIDALTRLRDEHPELAGRAVYTSDRSLFRPINAARTDRTERFGYLCHSGREMP